MKRSAYSFQPQLKVDCYHIAQAPKLFVRKVSLHDIIVNWVPLNIDKKVPQGDAYYIECQRHGSINWNTAKIYTSGQLIGRNNVFVVKVNQ